jgi:hypothetical protein
MNAKSLRRFTVRLAMFLLPFGLLAGAAVTLGVLSGEAMPLAQVFAIQDADPEVIYSPSNRELYFRYKQYGIARMRPDILVVGTSVLRYVRADLFASEGIRFYNGYLPAARTDEISMQMRQFTPDNAPQIIIVGIDMQQLRDGGRGIERQGDLSLADMLTQTRAVMRDALTGQQSIGQLLSLTDSEAARRLGLQATQDGRGFRFDGSFREHADALQRAQENLVTTIETQRRILSGDVRAGRLRAQPKPEIVERLIHDVAALEIMGVDVIGILMPFSMPSVMDAVAGAPLDDDLNGLRRALADGFTSAGAELFDHTDPRPLGLTDDDMPDGVHTTAEVTARLLTEIIQQSSALRPFAQ